MATSTVFLFSGAAVLAAAVIATIICLVVRHGKRKKLKNYLEDWY